MAGKEKQWSQIMQWGLEVLFSISMHAIFILSICFSLERFAFPLNVETLVKYLQSMLFSVLFLRRNAGSDRWVGSSSILPRWFDDNGCHFAGGEIRFPREPVTVSYHQSQICPWVGGG
jgi:hypothetical protein